VSVVANGAVFSRLRMRGLVGLGAVAAAALGAGAWLTVHLGGRESTDDAFVEAALVHVAAEIPGRVLEVVVGEHQRVRAGDLLLRLDPAPYRVALERARAELAAARNRLAEARAAAAAAAAEVRAAEVDRDDAERELARTRALSERGAASRRALERAEAARQAAVARLRAAQLRARAAAARVADDAEVRAAEAAVAAAELDLARVEVRAPFDGVVGRKSAEPGAVVRPGQALLALVSSEDVWVMGNFKETQIRRMRPGAPAEVRIDAFPGRVWRGHVDSFSPATGAVYALLAPDPAAGNFTKVVQRLPVRIVLDEPVGGGEGAPPVELAAGLSAEVTVLVR